MGTQKTKMDAEFDKFFNKFMEEMPEDIRTSIPSDKLGFFRSTIEIGYKSGYVDAMESVAKRIEQMI